ncbi:MAG: SGNH/GDSL hydrolase family protein [Ramlibacter sp.]|nr:SGNH/GDSL hydrolase family protein [Ramlibacter sp.]
MARNWLRRAVLVLACASAALLASCGSSSIESALTPSRFIAFGDGFSDLGQNGSRYTVNDGTINVWTAYMASLYGQTLTTASAGGLSYARGNARVVAKPDAAGNTATLTISEQIDAFLASNTLGADDVVVLNGGISDIVTQMAAVTAGSQTSADMIANVKQAGRDLGAQVRRLVQAGGKHVVVAGAYNLAKSPWAASIGQGDLLLEASSRFNEELLVSIVDLGANVLYVDTAFHYNLVTAVPANYDLTDATTAVCTSVDPGPGIGTGAGKVNSAQCTAGTILSGLNYTLYAFADGLYPTPRAHQLFGEYAYNRVRARW